MNAFRILDKDGKAISLKELNKEAAIFWGKEPDEYCSYPYKKTKFVNANNLEGEALQRAIRQHHWFEANQETINWDEKIGYAIANQGNYTSGWNNVAYTMYNIHFGGFPINTDNKEKVTLFTPEQIEIEIQAVLQLLKPFLELIQHWQEKGYQPEQVKLRAF